MTRVEKCDIYIELISYACTIVIVVGYLIIAHCMRMHIFAILSTLCDSSLNPLHRRIHQNIRMTQRFLYSSCDKEHDDA